MFWKRKKKLHVTSADKEWVDEALYWLRMEFGEAHFLELRTVTPTKDFYNRAFDGSEEDAYFILHRTMELMKIRGVAIELEFFSDGPMEMEDGSVLSSPADIHGRWNSASGTYEATEEQVIIAIERRQLKNTLSLIATIAHELAHFILLGENRIEENDELITDLTAIVYGFGICMGNSRFQYETFRTHSGARWQTNSQGYLPEQVIAYAMARLSLERNEPTHYSKFLNKTMKTYFDQSMDWLLENRGQTN